MKEIFPYKISCLAENGSQEFSIFLNLRKKEV